MTVLRYRFQPAASDDLSSLVDFLLAEAGPEPAIRFVRKARSTIEFLLSSPGIGSPVHTSIFQLSGLRKWHVEGFPKLLLFYLVRDDNLDVVRVLHSAADWHSLFDAD